jgi:carbon-monoxide dehydrogenase medium subunit
MAQAAGVLATPPVRALATIGGNIGRASPASDLAPALIVHGAFAEIEGTGGSRSESIEGLYVGPGLTTLARHDVVTSVFVPDSPPRSASVHLKLGSRGAGTDIAMVAVSVLVTLREGRLEDVRIALASVAPTPIRARQAEDMLRGAVPTVHVVTRAAEAAAEDCRPISDTRTTADHRRALARVLTRRALEGALAAAEREDG